MEQAIFELGRAEAALAEAKRRLTPDTAEARALAGLEQAVSALRELLWESA